MERTKLNQNYKFDCLGRIVSQRHFEPLYNSLLSENLVVVEVLQEQMESFEIVLNLSTGEVQRIYCLTLLIVMNF